MEITPEYELTPDGPLLRGANAVRLRELLRSYEAKLAEFGPPLSESMYPGIDRVEVEVKLASRGLSCPAEVVEWFGWKNGVVLDGVRTAGIPMIFPATLDQALRAYDDSRIELEDALTYSLDYEGLAYGAVEGWLRLQSISESVAVECVASGDTPPRVRWAAPDFIEPHRAGKFRAVSLCTVISRWIESADRGAFAWDESQHRWMVDDSRVLTDLTESILG